MSMPASTGPSKSHVDLNAQAVCLMNKGCYDKALWMLKGALNHINLRIAQDLNATGNVVDSSSGSNFDLNAVQLEEGLDDKDSSSTSFFNRAFLIQGQAEQMSGSIHVLCTGAILYNIALIHHLVGLQDAEKRDKNYQRAMSVYGSASHIFSSCGNEYSHLPAYLLGMLAFLLNQSHIYSMYLRDTDKAQQCYQGIGLLTSSTEVESYLTYEELTRVRVIVFILIGRYPHAAAA